MRIVDPQPAIEDIDSILGTTEENKQNPATPPTKSPQLHAPRPKEMQRILHEHQQKMIAIENDKKEMEGEKKKQRLLEEHRRVNDLEERVQTGQSSAPPPSPVAAMSPVGSTRFLDETPLVAGPPSVVSRGPNAPGSFKAVQSSSEYIMVEVNYQATENVPLSIEEILDDHKSGPARRCNSPPRRTSSNENHQKNERVSSCKSRTPSPMEGGKEKKDFITQ